MAAKNTIMQEFKKFITRGNVVDLAVGIIIGTAFTAIVNSLVKDIVMPFIGWILGGVNFADLKVIIHAATADTAEVALTYGNFIQRVVDFLVIALVVFLFVRIINKFREKMDSRKKVEEVKQPAPVVPQDIILLSEIRDLLKKQK
ncbi:large-conductance mechanosensitive channel protein MscL [uncultured Sphaerochaeta sp.]|uniref:large-conductance mechanosensitive channel protein MscL n=1 Tax=uncultured Sphaerochaeta sp. TaxID=886478 RepID=UPI002A0A2E06|nr:large-conductance mechanosensitive channel protein MscL [uncultured Sphaerochaeta sp.]